MSFFLAWELHKVQPLLRQVNIPITFLKEIAMYRVMKLSKRLVLTIAAAATLLGLAGTSYAQAALDNIQKTKLIKIAIPTDFPPYGFVGGRPEAPGSGHRHGQFHCRQNGRQD